jgi:hypothetical protein
MFQMPLYSVVLYIATRLHLDGQVVDDSMIALFGRAGLFLTAREIFADDGTAGDVDTVH